MGNQASSGKGSKSIERKATKVDDLHYYLTDQSKQASLFSFSPSIIQTGVYVPRTIEVGKHEYRVTTIFPSAFQASEIQSFKFAPDSELLLITQGAFKLSKIQSISIPRTVIAIEEHAFSSCENLATIEIPADSALQTMDRYAFFNSAIQRIFIPAGITEINDYLFSLCGKLTTVDFAPNSQVRIIKKKAFSDTAIEQITLPASVHTIEEAAFESCKRLKRIDITPDSKLRAIQKNAFSLSKLESLSLPSGMTTLDDGWNCNVNSLKEINILPIGDDNIQFLDGKILVGKSKPTNDLCDILYYVNKDLTELEVPYHVQTISQHAFLSCLFLAKVEFPADTQLTKICKGAFFGCGVKSIRIPRTVTSIEEFAFQNCSFLKCIEVPQDMDLQKVGPSLLELNEKIVRY